MRFVVHKNSMQADYISGGCFISEELWKHRCSILDDYEIIICTKGTFSLNIMGRVQEVSSGNGLVLFPGEKHYGIEESSDVSFYWLHFRFYGGVEQVWDCSDIANMVPPISVDKNGDCVLKEYFQVSNMERIVILIKQLLYYQETYKYNKRPSSLMMELVLYEISSQTINNIRLINEERDRYTLEKVYEYMRANYYRDIHISDLAKVFGYNPQYFARMFHKKTGMSPKQYILRQKIEKAKYLLDTTQFQIKEIACQVGINDARMLTKAFKRYEGMSPTQYKASFCKTHINSR